MTHPADDAPTGADAAPDAPDTETAEAIRDRVRRHLAEVDRLPVTEHAAAFDAVQRDLTQVLQRLAGETGRG